MLLYSIDTFPSFWKNFRNLITSPKGIAIELVGHELRKKDDGCYKWFAEEDQEYFFIEISEAVQNEVTQMMSNPNYQRLVEERKGVFGTDPFVIALAKVEGLTVVTGEKPTRNIRKPKIPDVCDDMGVEWISILGLMREEKWQF